MMDKKTKDKIYGISPKETKQRMEEAEQILQRIYQEMKSRADGTLDRDCVGYVQMFNYLNNKGML